MSERERERERENQVTQVSSGTDKTFRLCLHFGHTREREKERKKEKKRKRVRERERIIEREREGNIERERGKKPQSTSKDDEAFFIIFLQ